MLYLRPFFSYFGSKWRLAPSYPRPEHETVIEPFAGGAGYACRHYKRRVILVEKDPRVAALWRWLIKVSPAEVLRIPLFGGGVQTVDDMHGICEEARLLVGYWCGQASSGGPRPKPGTFRNEQYWSLRAKLRVAQQVQRVRHWEVIEGSYEDAPDVEATWFVDAPYVEAGKNYRHREIVYPRLGGWCLARRGLLIACENAGADWLPFESHAHIIGATKEASGARMTEEVVYVQRR